MGLKYIVGIFCLIAVLGRVTEACTPEEQEQCKLPACQCPQLSPPNGMDVKDTPQIVYMTFDDGINIANYPIYQELIFNRKNPNGHPITATFYVLHQYNDYNLTRDVWRRGHEIALHSITHANSEYYKTLSAEGWRQEIVEQKQMLANFANIPESTITGMRAPFLQTGGDTMMDVIYGKLQYDCSRPTLTFANDPALWPYTLDFNREFQDCQIAPCAVKQYKGFWNVPMVDWIGDDGNACAMMDQCLPNPDTPEKVLSLMKRNFLRSYEGNRAPVGMFVHAAWLTELFPGHKEGYAAFLDYLGTLNDVYIVSVQKAIEWFKTPTPLATIKEFKPWQVTEKPGTCAARSCPFPADKTPFGSERYMTQCKNPCPPYYPWLGNPLGTKPY
jgi:peptidoglycan/xylan/chitin deacetylase (PgdA/CDA1 family)